MTEPLNDERMRILEQIERGDISAAEGMQRLEQLAAESPIIEQTVIDSVMAATEAPPPVDADIARWKRWWTLPFAIGIGITTLAALLMLSAIQASGYGFWFFCLWAPFIAGVVVIALAWGSRTSRWLHVRVNTGSAEWPRKIAISFPIPIRLTAWLLRTFGPKASQLRNTSLDELILALNENTSDSRPLYVDVTDGDKGERVQVFLG